MSDKKINITLEMQIAKYLVNIHQAKENIKDLDKAIKEMNKDSGARRDLIVEKGKAQANLIAMQNELKKTEKSMQELGNSSKTSMAMMATGIAAAMYILNKIKSVATEWMNIRREEVKLEKQIGAAIISTGSAAGLTSKEIIKYAEAMAKQTGISKNQILASEAMLLTFTKIGKDVFPMATEATLNMAKVFGGDASDKAIQLGKALQDPILGATALRRVGIMLSETQKEQIKYFMGINKVSEAQKIILQEINTEFGGVANATASVSGKFGVLMTEIKAALGGLILSAINPLLEGVLKISDMLSDNSKIVTEGLTEYDMLAGKYTVLAEKTNKTAFEQREYQKVIKELQANYPEYLRNLNLETGSREEISLALKKQRDLQRDVLILQMQEADTKKLLEERLRIEMELLESKANSLRIEEELSKLTKGKDYTIQLEIDKRLAKEKTISLEKDYAETTKEINEIESKYNLLAADKNKKNETAIDNLSVENLILSKKAELINEINLAYEQDLENEANRIKYNDELTKQEIKNNELAEEKRLELEKYNKVFSVKLKDDKENINIVKRTQEESERLALFSAKSESEKLAEAKLNKEIFDSEKQYIQDLADFEVITEEQKLQRLQDLRKKFGIPEPEKEKSDFDKKLAAFKEYSDQILSIANSTNEIQLNNISNEYNTKKEALDKQLSDEKITKEKYDREMLKLDMKRKKEEKDAKNQSKIWAISEIGINTLVEASKSWSKPWLTALIIAAGVAAAAKVATIKYKRGGISVGASHENGGIKLVDSATGNITGEMRGGEGIVVKEAMDNPEARAAVSEINERFGGVRFPNVSRISEIRKLNNYQAPRFATGGVVPNITNFNNSSNYDMLKTLSDIKEAINLIPAPIVNLSAESDIIKLTKKVTLQQREILRTGRNFDEIQ